MNQDEERHTADCADRAFVERVQRGDRKAFDLLVVKYQGRVQALIARFVREPQDVRDVAQDAFIKAFRSIGQFRGDSAFYTWLYRIAVNCAKTHLSRHSKGVVLKSLDEEGLVEQGQETRVASSPEGELSGAQLHGKVQESIQSLPEELRVALLLREYDGMSYEQIGEVLNCPVGTVRSRIFRAREQVMAVVAAYQQVDSAPMRRSR